MTISIHQQKELLTPTSFSQYLRAQGKIFWWPKGNFWVITDYAVAKSLLKGQDTTCDRTPFFLSRMPKVDLSLMPDFFSVVRRMMVMSDDDTHQKRRRICYEGFSSNTINKMIPSIKQQVLSITQKLVDSQTIDFMKHYANPIPIRTLADFFDIPQQDRQQFATHAKTMTAFFGGGVDYNNETAIAANEAAKILKAYFLDLAKDRKNKPKEDFLSSLLKYQKHFGLDDEDIISQAIMMWVAGMVTTSDQMANNCFTLVSEHQDILHDKPDLRQFEVITEEASRLDPAVTFTFRLARNNIHIESTTIKAGQTIFISNHAINRDNNFYSTPDRINLEHNNRHFSYGFASHYCLGAKLSLIEMQLALHALFNRFPYTKIVDYKRNHYSLSFSGFHHLQLELKE